MHNGSLWITQHDSGKLTGLVSINTSSLENPFCQTRQQNPSLICGHCYSRRLERLRPNLEALLKANSDQLSQKVLAGSEIPHFAPGATVRFNSFGEIVNKTHFENILKICRENPLVQFGLWTKRWDILLAKSIKAKPRNLSVIFSNPRINNSGWFDFGHDLTPRDYAKTLAWVDKFFCVRTQVNDVITGPAVALCQSHCFSCMRCYNPCDAVSVIVEKLR